MLAPIIVGFAMATLGVAMLFLGAVPFVAGRRIPALRSRLIGGVLVSFLPLAFGLYQLIHLVFGRDTVEGPVVLWSVFSVCWVAVTVILFRVLLPKRECKARPETTSPFGEPAAPVEEFALPDELRPTQKSPAKKAGGKKPTAGPAESNPFDFS